MSGAGRLFNQLASLLLGLSGLVTLVVAAVFILDPFGPARVAQVAPVETPTITPTPSLTRPPTWTPTATPPGPTFSPFKFTKTNDEIRFASDPYGAQCGTWMGVSGVVLDRDGSPLAGVAVVGWGGPVPEQDKRVFVSGSSGNINATYGSPAAYEIYIGAPGEYDFYIQVYENGQPVSEAIQLRMRLDCRANMAVLNLQRNH